MRERERERERGGGGERIAWNIVEVFQLTLKDKISLPFIDEVERLLCI